MATKFQILVSLVVLLSFSSCFKEEDKIEPHPIGDVILDGVEMGDTYENIIYYDLISESIITTTHIEDWDLAFDSRENEWAIYLNSSRLMYAANTESQDFDATIILDSLDFTMDISDGDPNKTAIGKWYNEVGDSIQSKNNVYVLNLGSNANFQAMGYIKVQILPKGNSYEIKLAKLDGSEESTYMIAKSPDYERVFLQYKTGQQTIAPKAEEWTLNFTKYSTVINVSDGTVQDYSVNGVLLNRNSCFAVKDSINKFEDITIEDTKGLVFPANIDEIGYEWKFYSFDDGIYTIVPNLSFIIRDHKGYYYKLRFVDFYNESGTKGSPQFEYVKL